jgi:DnaJ-class molecular chaperone
MSEYLKPTDADAFADMEVKSPAGWEEIWGKSAMCQKCKGHGGWNLKLDAFGPGKHFRASCDNCNGWGCVSAKQGAHVHEWDRGQALSQHNTRYICATCKRTWDVDSSG